MNCRWHLGSSREECAYPHGIDRDHHGARELGSSATSRGVVRLAFTVALAEAVALAVAAAVTGSAAMLAQTAASVADVGVEVFLLIGVAQSARSPDSRHPLGYGRERFFWSLFAAIGLFVGGGGVAIEQAIRMSLHPTHVSSYLAGYSVLVATVLLDAIALTVALRPLRELAATRGRSIYRLLLQSTDPASSTVVVGNLAGVLGGLAAIAALGGRQLTGSATPDVLASALIGIMLMAGSAQLVRTNRDLLTGRGVSPVLLEEMRHVVEAQQGVVAVQDLFAVVVGPSTLVVNGDVTLDDTLDVPEAESALRSAANALRASWRAVDYVYLTPVAEHRPRSGRASVRARGNDDPRASRFGEADPDAPGPTRI